MTDGGSVKGTRREDTAETGCSSIDGHQGRWRRIDTLRGQGGRSMRCDSGSGPKGPHRTVMSRDATFRKMTNRNQTDTNEIATTETKYQTDFYSAEKYQYLTKF